MDIKQSGSQPSTKGPAEYFTGTVRIDPLFQANDPARSVGASVTFEPGARTAWHTHPLGQTLIVTAGCGLGTAVGRPNRGNSAGWRGLVPAGQEALARCHGDHGHDAHCHSGTARRKDRRLDGKGQRRSIPCRAWLHAGTNIMNNNNIVGKVVVITGASSGLGESTARLLSAQGASVVLGARRVDRLRSLVDELTGSDQTCCAGPIGRAASGSKALQHPHHGNLAGCGSHGTTEHHDRDGYRRESPQVGWDRDSCRIICSGSRLRHQPAWRGGRERDPVLAHVPDALRQGEEQTWYQLLAIPTK